LFLAHGPETETDFDINFLVANHLIFDVLHRRSGIQVLLKVSPVFSKTLIEILSLGRLKDPMDGGKGHMVLPTESTSMAWIEHSNFFKASRVNDPIACFLLKLE
jgi:hypothetical protein